MFRRPLQSASRSRRRIGLASLLPVLAIAVPVNVALFAGEAALSGPASAQTGGDTSYSLNGNPAVTTITNGTSAAPWNTSQGDPDFPNYASQSPGTLTPVYTPGGATENVGGVTEPNLAVYPSSSSGTDGDFPYPSGTVGTPGPLTGYCGTGNNTTASSGSPTRQPASTTLPLLTGLLPSHRPESGRLAHRLLRLPPQGRRRGDRRREVHRQRQGLDLRGRGPRTEPRVLPVSGHQRRRSRSPEHPHDRRGHSYLYTLQRPAGDNVGVGMLVHALNPTSADPLNGVPSTEKVGVDPDAFATNTAPLPIPFTGGTPVNIPLNQTGVAGSPEQLIASSATPGAFVDLTDATPSADHAT